MERLQQLLDERLSKLPTVEQTELEALAYLSTDTLRVIADEQLPSQAQQRMAALMALNSTGTLAPDERSELAHLVKRGDQLMLRKAEARLLLQQRACAHNTNPLLSAHA